MIKLGRACSCDGEAGMDGLTDGASEPLSASEYRTVIIPANTQIIYYLIIWN